MPPPASNAAISWLRRHAARIDDACAPLMPPSLPPGPRPHALISPAGWGGVGARAARQLLTTGRCGRHGGGGLTERRRRGGALAGAPAPPAIDAATLLATPRPQGSVGAQEKQDATTRVVGRPRAGWGALGMVFIRRLTFQGLHGVQPRLLGRLSGLKLPNFIIFREAHPLLAARHVGLQCGDTDLRAGFRHLLCCVGAPATEAATTLPLQPGHKRPSLHSLQ